MSDPPPEGLPPGAVAVPNADDGGAMPPGSEVEGGSAGHGGLGGPPAAAYDPTE
jgi:hypothetical protein